MTGLPRLAAGVHQLDLDVEGPLRVTLVVPGGHAVDRPAPLVVSLHYAGEVTPFYGRGLIEKLIGPALADLRAVIVAPDARDGDWTTPLNERTVVWLTRQALSVYTLDPRRVLLIGFSMGARGTWHIGPRHPDLFTAAIAIAGRPSPGPDWRIPLCVLHSQDDELVPLGPTRQRAEEQRDRGSPVEMRVLTGYAHNNTASYVDPLREAIPWLQRVWNDKGD